MIPLDTTTRKLQAFLAGAITTTNPTVTVSFFDVPEQTKEDNSDYRRAPQFTVLAGVTETDICAAPNQGVVRHIEYVSIHNTDTASVTVSVVVDDGGTNRIQFHRTLLTRQTAVFTRQSGWQIITVT